MDERLVRRLESIAARYRRVRMWRSLSIAWSLTAAIGAICLLLKWRGVAAFADTGWLLLAVATILTIAILIAVRASFRDERWIASRVEGRFPDLRQRLITAIDQRTVDGHYGFLQRQVIDETLQHAALRPWAEKTVPRDQIAMARLLNVPAFLFLAVVITGLLFSEVPHNVVGNSVVNQPIPTQVESKVTIKPGDVEVERGTSLIIVARFDGPVPADATLVSITSAVGDSAVETATDPSGRQSLPMSRSLDDPVFAGSFPQVNDEFIYYVEYAARRTDSYRVTVFEYPALLRADAQITYPSYTGLNPRLIEDARRVSAVEGSTIEWRCHLNKRVMSAVLIDGKGRSTYLEPADSAATMYSAAIQLTESRHWTLQLVDDAGRTNPYPVELDAKATPNGPPKIKLETARDVQVSPLEELTVAAGFHDDYGLTQFGVAYSLGGESPTEIVLGADVSGKQQQAVEHVLDFESFAAEPDQLLSYHFWADDYDSDGNVRRTFSDMYFAEVRPFEEIFRQGESPPGGQQPPSPPGQNAQQAEQLAELQKQIINATWKVIRREGVTAPANYASSETSAALSDDVRLLRESQSTAMEQLAELVQNLDDPESLGHAEEVRIHMQRAIDALSATLENPSIDSLPTAMSAEQASYQGLLRLRAREHEVVRSQQQQSSSSSSSSSSRSQQQLEDLELDNEQNRYETELQAQTAQQQQQEEQQREVRQVLNRLRELAQRQEDLNKQLQELQSALEAAETEEDRETIRRQLQRLREQEQQLLRDTDELADRLDQAQDQPQMQESREQLDETRENVRQANEALNENDASKALTAGTRAEREFKRMRDDFRREAANQFSEEMREMREQAQSLDDQQQELGEKITTLPKAQSGRLRSGDSRDQIREGLQRQREDLEKLLDRMQETVQQAETSEPLLAENLYDSFRETKQRRVEQNLAATDELLRRGMDSQAQQIDQLARKGINDLRNDIEQAAESVLGDETEGLRRALGELDQLVRELDNEMNTADPKKEGQEGKGSQNGRPSDKRSDRLSQQSGENQAQTQNERQQQDQQPGANPQPGQNQQPGQDQQQGESSQQGENQPPSQNQSGEGQQSSGQQQSNQEQPPNQNPSGQPGSTPNNQNQTPRNQPDQRIAGQRDSGGGLAPFNDSQGSAPLTGEGFRDWSDRLRDVEEMVDDPALRSEAARVRDRAREIRLDYKRQSKEPQWDDVRKLVAEPLRELRQRVSQELLRRSAERTSLVPIDRDAVPDEFAEQVRRYYEQLGSGD